MSGTIDDHGNALKPGFQLDDYRIERVLGAGGFGITYLATDANLDRQVAIKEFLPSGIAVRLEDTLIVEPVSSSDEEDFRWGLDRFRREAETLVGLRHPHIVNVFRLFEANGTAYLVMAYEDGESLATILRRAERLPQAELEELLFPLLDGLELVHRSGFLHRDIKPANIFIKSDGSPMLLDFGAARQALGHKSRSLTSVVSSGYAPLEQYSSHGNQGPWTDIYSLGAVLYVAAVGKKVPDAPGRVRSDGFVPASDIAAGQYAPEFLAAIDAALAVDETERPQTVADWRAMFPSAVTSAATDPASPASAGATESRIARKASEDSTIAPGPRKKMRARQSPMRRLLPWVAGAAAIALLGAVATYAIIEITVSDEGSGVRAGNDEGARQTGSATSDSTNGAERPANADPNASKPASGANREQANVARDQWQTSSATRIDSRLCNRTTLAVRNSSFGRDSVGPDACLDPRLTASGIRYNRQSVVWRISAKGGWIDCHCSRP